MRLGDLDALKKRVRQSTVSRPIQVAMEVLINTAPTIDAIRAAGGWISVKERLPEPPKEGTHD